MVVQTVGRPVLPDTVGRGGDAGVRPVSGRRPGPLVVGRLPVVVSSVGPLTPGGPVRQFRVLGPVGCRTGVVGSVRPY